MTLVEVEIRELNTNKPTKQHVKSRTPQQKPTKN